MGEVALGIAQVVALVRGPHGLQVATGEILVVRELGHAFDPRLGATAQQNAFEQGGFRQQTLVRTESEAAGQINAYLLMSEARSNLRAAAANPYVNLPFDPNMQVTAFRFARSGRTA